MWSLFSSSLSEMCEETGVRKLSLLRGLCRKTGRGRGEGGRGGGGVRKGADVCGSVARCAVVGAGI